MKISHKITQSDAAFISLIVTLGRACVHFDPSQWLGQAFTFWPEVGTKPCVTVLNC